MSNAVQIAATLTRRQSQALEILVKAERPLRNKDFHERFETDGRRTTGWSRALGPCTKARTHDPASLWASGLVSVVDNCSYIVTALGREVASALGAGAIRRDARNKPRCADTSAAIGPAARQDTANQALKPTPLIEQARHESSFPNLPLFGPLDLDTLSKRAREAVACSYCFMGNRAHEWGRVPQRPADRPDDVAFAPWIGRRYLLSNPRVVVMMLNPGHAAAPHKLKRRDFGHQLRDGTIGYEEYISCLTPLFREWGFGAIVRWLGKLRLEPERIAFLNVALCAVADDAYFAELFGVCFQRHTRGMLACLNPHIVLLCGKTELEPYCVPIGSMGATAILTWHYRSMNTKAGQRELARVRGELNRLGC